MPDASDDPIIQQFWQSCWDSKSTMGQTPKEFQVWGFGNTPEMADKLGDLVRSGVKTATASLAWAYENGDESYPEIGGYSVIINGHGKPLCIIRTTDVTEHPFNEVGPAHAYQEGEGDRSLGYWRQAHWDFFGEECARIGRKPDERMPVVCEVFELICT